MRFLLALTGVTAFTFLKDGAGDPQCKLGIRSLGGEAPVCCPKYCGECDDYATCANVNGQDSANACCATKVRELTCRADPSNPHCLLSCKEKSAPCFLDENTWTKPQQTTAAEDCDNAQKEWKDQAKATVEGIDADNADHGGPTQWRDLQDRANNAFVQRNDGDDEVPDFFKEKPVHKPMRKPCKKGGKK